MHTTSRSTALTTFAAALVVASSLFAPPAAARTAQAPAAPATAAAAKAATPYTRALNGADGAVTGVQTAIRTFTPTDPAGGPTVHLVAVTHIGEADYYKELQQFLDRQSVVFYEGVKMGGGATPKPAAAGAPAPKPSAPPPPTAAAAAGSPIALQQRLSRALGVRFQLEAIDYKRPHFRNSDLSWQEMERLAGQSGEATAQQLSQMRTMLGGGTGSAPGGTAALVASLMGQVEKSPAVAQMFRRLLVTTLADPDALAKLQASAAAAAQTPPEKKEPTSPPLHRPGELNRILIAERNKAVVKDLAAALPGLDRGASVALFYGAAHMADLEARLVKELGYREATDAPPRWLTALLAAPPTPTP